MNKFVHTLWLGLWIGCALLVQGAYAAPQKPGHVEVELIMDSATLKSGQPLWIGLRMKHDPRWHSYWKNPGDAGLPTRIKWTLPAGWSADDIEWPAPRRIPVGPLASYGFEGEIVLPVLLHPVRGWDGKSPVTLSAQANWLACSEQCIPEDAKLEMKLPGRRSSHDDQLFAAARARTPQASEFKVASAKRISGKLVLTLEPATDGEFFPDKEEVVEPGDPTRVNVTGKRAIWTGTLGRAGKAMKAPARVSGVWVPRNGVPMLVDARLN